MVAERPPTEHHRRHADEVRGNRDARPERTSRRAGARLDDRTERLLAAHPGADAARHRPSDDRAAPGRRATTAGRELPAADCGPLAAARESLAVPARATTLGGVGRQAPRHHRPHRLPVSRSSPCWSPAIVGLFVDVRRQALIPVLAAGFLLVITPSIVDRLRSRKVGYFEIHLIRQIAATARKSADALRRLGMDRELDAYATIYTELRGPELMVVRAKCSTGSSSASRTRPSSRSSTRTRSRSCSCTARRSSACSRWA